MGYCQGSPVATTQSTCQANGGQWLADPSTSGGSGSGSSMSPSEWMSGIGNLLGPLANFGSNMYAISQQQPTQPYYVPGGISQQNPNGVQNPNFGSTPGGNNMTLWIILAVVAVILIGAGIYIAAKKAKAK